ncbi:ABC transporter ATP-binding protein [Pleionea sediminis]|uniref:ABC transporter ATP-binding protein n=1 Tax=Pleionea sediminis TaxID=2569479 RepID=UPI001186BF02|nr:ABC transporter ATP-binding protein [Pleionea sediminis]
MSNTVFKSSHLCWRAADKLILDQLNFSIKQGEFVGLIGPNGAGKSSLLRCLYQKITQYQGEISFLDRDIKSYSRQELASRIAVVLQEPPSQFSLKVYDVIAMGLTPHKSLLSFDTASDRTQIEAAATQVDLTDKLEQYFNSLSGGEKQRAMIARAMVQKPQVLLMDEPTNHLDIRHQLEVLDLARSLDITVIVSIHDLNLAAAFCDRFILMNKGQIVANGSHENVLTEQHLNSVFGVHAHVDQHPFHKGPRITFDLGDKP